MGSRIFKQQTLQRVVHDKTLDGDGTPQAPLGVASGAFLTDTPGAVDLANLATDVGTLTSITTNSDGTSIRFQLGSLGIQICAHRLNLGSRITNGSGSHSDPYRTNATSWDYPEPFDSVIAANGEPEVSTATGLARMVSVFHRETTNTQMVQVQATALTDNATDVDIIANIWAIGTWTP